MMGAIPRQIRACEEDNLTPLFACELYLQDKHPSKEVFEKMTGKEKQEIRKSYHLLAIAYSNEGYKNLVQLSSWAWMNGFYYRPRVTHEQLNLHKEGIIFTSCCYNGEIGQAFDKDGEEAAFKMVEKYHKQFGENFYLELMLLDFNKQKPFDEFLIKAHDKYKIPLILTNDCHYANKEDSKYQRYMLMIQKDSSIKTIEAKLAAAGEKADVFEMQDTNLWMKSEEELNQKWFEMYQDVIPYDMFVKAKENTVAICQKAKNVQIDRSVKLPQFPDAEDRFKESLIEGAKWRGVINKRKYIDRIKEEYELICRKGFASYFLIQKQMTDEARRICPEILGWGDGSEAVGPGRGCLTGDTQVLTLNGFGELKDVKIGDRVMTRTGDFRLVTDCMKYDVKEKLVNITSYYGDGKGVTMTSDHKVYVEKMVRPPNYESWGESTQKSRKSIVEPTGVCKWVAAEDVEIGDWVFTPSVKVEVIKRDGIDLAEFDNGYTMHSDNESVFQDRMNPLTGKLLCCWSVCWRWMD